MKQPLCYFRVRRKHLMKYRNQILLLKQNFGNCPPRLTIDNEVTIVSFVQSEPDHGYTRQAKVTSQSFLSLENVGLAIGGNDNRAVYISTVYLCLDRLEGTYDLGVWVPIPVIHPSHVDGHLGLCCC